jgi:hypothetical protein
VGLDIAPLLASAGALGLAIGLGAQKLAQDVIRARLWDISALAALDKVVRFKAHGSSVDVIGANERQVQC